MNEILSTPPQQDSEHQPLHNLESGRNPMGYERSDNHIELIPSQRVDSEHAADEEVVDAELVDDIEPRRRAAAEAAKKLYGEAAPNAQSPGNTIDTRL